MEKVIQEATDNITRRMTPNVGEQTVLTKCAVEVATIALTVYKDDLREKALKVASAIADLEDELSSPP